MGSGARAPGGQQRREVCGQTTLLAAAGLTVSARLGRAPATTSRCAHRRPRPAAASSQPHLVSSRHPDAPDTAPALPLLRWERYYEARNVTVTENGAGHEGERPRVAVSASELLAHPPHTRNVRTTLSRATSYVSVRVSLGMHAPSQSRFAAARVCEACQTDRVFQAVAADQWGVFCRSHFKWWEHPPTGTPKEECSFGRLGITSAPSASTSNEHRWRFSSVLWWILGRCP